MVIYFGLTNVFCSTDYFEFLVLISCRVIPKSRWVVGRSGAEITGAVLRIPVCPGVWRIWRRSPGWPVNAYIIISSQVGVFFLFFSSFPFGKRMNLAWLGWLRRTIVSEIGNRVISSA
ncbi:hypothetical protein L873DRAFT_123776 [Choiromyces venosus 120613-1]|uniref:Uncharacterized protein n=1 Tax=Choiromyces venosus 120613-1 TaxID=1336337 RepID=A0A3N4J428_9PEZI|nr:hypothetical protein L873DRAFT_123776 [Choiromyces venosus 120613-1]